MISIKRYHTAAHKATLSLNFLLLLINNTPLFDNAALQLPNIDGRTSGKKKHLLHDAGLV